MHAIPARLPEPVIRRIALALATIVGCAAIAWALQQLEGATAPLAITRGTVDTMPWTHYAPATPRPGAPLVVVAHGFAGSQQLMQPFAVTLARNGIPALTFDFPGHGRTPVPLAGGLTDLGGSTRALIDALSRVVAHAAARPDAAAGVALLGHSMASDIVIRVGQANAAVRAVVAVSAFSPDVTATSPRNLLVVDGALEPAMLVDEGRRVVGLANDGQPAETGRLYGDFAAGTARALVLADGVEHITVLYSREALDAARRWIALGTATGTPAIGPGAAFPPPDDDHGFVDARGRWIALLLAGVVLLAVTLAPLLPRVSDVPHGAGLPLKRVIAIALVPTVATPLLLWKAPTDFLPIALGDYILAHFALFGVLAYVTMRWVDRRHGARRPAFLDTGERVSHARFALATALVAAYATFGFGFAIDRYFTNLWPVTVRIPLVLALFAGTLPYFLVDEWLTRGPNASRMAYFATKLLFLVSLAIAIALSLEKLFFLVIIVPAILALFFVYGFLSARVYRRTGHPFVAATANALAFAWFIAVVFPLVGR